MEPFSINEDLSTYSDAEIADLVTQGNSALDAVLAEDPTPATADEAERIDAALTALAAEQANRTAATERLSALRDRRAAAAADSQITASDESGEQEQEDDSADESGEADSEDQNADAEGDDDTNEGDAEGDADDNEEGESTVTASSQTRGLRGSRPADDAEGVNRQPIAIRAASDVPQFSTGQVLGDIDEVARALASRIKGFPSKPQGIPGGQMQRYGVATFTRQFDEEHVATGNNDLEVVERVSQESRLDGGSLVAAGGWCAPSETLYDLCAGETTDGLLDLPEMQVTRGGVRFTSGPSFADFYGNGFKQTEAQAIAGTAKTCYEIECPDFEEVRLDAVGLCIKVPLLTNAAYPELTRRVIAGSLIAHQHKVSADLISGIVTKAGTKIVAGSVGSVASNSLNAVDLVATTERERYRLGMNDTLEVLAPHWLRNVIRADLGMRNGVDMMAVSDQQIDSFFAARKVRVQWLYNWQPLEENGTIYPNKATLVVYPGGTFTKGVTDVISLDAVYDAASLQENTMTGLFMEEGVLLLQRCWKAKAVEITVCAGGNTGAANNAACFAGADQTPTP